MNGQLDVINAWKGRTSCTSFVRCNDMWLAKDNRFLNPMSTYERNLMAPTCLIINNYYGATDILCFPFHHHCLAQPLIDSVDVWFPSSQSNNHMLALIINCGTNLFSSKILFFKSWFLFSPLLHAFIINFISFSVLFLLSPHLCSNIFQSIICASSWK